MCNAGLKLKTSCLRSTGNEDLMALVQLWALKPVTLVEEEGIEPDQTEGMEGLSSAEACAALDETRTDVVEKVCFAAPILQHGFEPSRPALRSTCLFCVLFEHCDAKPEDIPAPLLTRIHGIPLEGKQPEGGGWLNAMARRHNKEQHALNGNIDADDIHTPFDEVVKSLVIRYRTEAAEYVSARISDEAMVLESENEWLTTTRTIDSDKPLYSGEVYGTCHTFRAVARNEIV